MFNPEISARPSVASDFQMARMHHAMSIGLEERGTIRPAQSALDRHGRFVGISGSRLRLFAPGVAGTLQVGRHIRIESYAPLIDDAGVATPAQLEVVITRPRWSPMSTETIAITQSDDPDLGCVVRRAVEPRRQLAEDDRYVSAEDHHEQQAEALRFAEAIGHNAITEQEVDALGQVAEQLPYLARPGLHQLVGYAGLACAGIYGYYGVSPNEA